MRGGALRIATIFGIPVQIHWSFGLLFVWVFFYGTDKAMSGKAIQLYMLHVLAIFFCVILHEFGHALAARRYQIHTRSITLYPIGGVASLTGLPSKPVQELVIAIAGPMVNVVIALLLYIGLYVAGISPLDIRGEEIADIYENTANFVPLLFLVNVMLVIFNMLPAFPMDGGRVLRALLAMRFGRLQATRWAALLGQLMAIGFIGYALYNEELTLGLVGIFVFTTAMAENRFVKVEVTLRDFTVAQLYQAQFTPLYRLDPIEDALLLLNKGQERSFLIIDDWTQQPYGILSETALHHAIKNKNQHAKIDNYVKVGVPHVQLHDSLMSVFALFQQSGAPLAVVWGDDRKPIGIITKHAIDYFIELRSKYPV